MTGIDRDGRRADHTPRVARATPSGKLSARQVADLQELILKGLIAQGYTQVQASQVINQSRRTTFNRLHRAEPTPARPYV